MSGARDRWTDIEEYLIAFLIKYPDAGKRFIPQLKPDLFASEHTRTVFQSIIVQSPAVDGSVAEQNEVTTNDGDTDELKLMLLKAERYVEALGEFDPNREIESFISELSLRQVRKRLRELALDLKNARGEMRQRILEEFSLLSARLHKDEYIG